MGCSRSRLPPAHAPDLLGRPPEPEPAPRRRPGARSARMAQPPGRGAGRVVQHAEVLPARPGPLHGIPGGRDITEPTAVTEAHVSDFLASLREGSEGHPPLAPSSAARTLVAVRGFHRFLVLEGDTAQDPAGAVSPPRPPSRLPKAISVDDVERLLSAAAVGDTPAALRDRALLEVLYGAGARISEAVGLDIDDVDAEEGVVRLFGKGARSVSSPSARMPRRLFPPTSSGAARRWRRRARARRPSSSTSGAGGCRGRARGPRFGRPRSAPGCPDTCRRTPCGTRSPRTCSTAAPTSGSCRSSSGTPR